MSDVGAGSSSSSLETLAKTASGMTAGALSAVLCSPLDVAKT